MLKFVDTEFYHKLLFVPCISFQLPQPLLLVLYLSLPTFNFRGRKNEYSRQRGWRPLANTYYSRNRRIYWENPKERNEVYAEVWMGNIRQHITSRTEFMVLGLFKCTPRSLDGSLLQSSIGYLSSTPPFALLPRQRLFRPVNLTSMTYGAI